MQRFIDTVPAWALFVIALVSLIAAEDVGRRLGKRRDRAGPTADQEYVGTLVTATLGLFGFLLAFAFGAAQARFEVRRKLVIEDANAIGTTYLRAEMLPEPSAGRVRDLLREYVEVRKTPPAEELGTILRRSEELHNALWSEANAAARAAPTPITALFVTSLNQVIDLHTERLTVAFENRIPAVVWLYVAVLGLLAMLFVGYDSPGFGLRRHASVIGLAGAFSLVIVLVMELDRPLHGIQVSQKVMFELARSMQSSGR